MKGTTHYKSALESNIGIVATTSVLCMNYKIETPVLTLVPLLWLPLGAVGGLFPDIDMKGSKFRNNYRKYYVSGILLLLTILFVVPIVYSNLIGQSTTDLTTLANGYKTSKPVLALLPIIAFLIFVDVRSNIWYHRGETHSIIFCMLPTLITLPFALLANDFIVINLAIGFSLGALNHMYCDSFNTQPQKEYLYPIHKLRGGPRCKLSAKEKKKYSKKRVNRCEPVDLQDNGEAESLFLKQNRIITVTVHTLIIVLVILYNNRDYIQQVFFK